MHRYVTGDRFFIRIVSIPSYQQLHDFGPVIVRLIRTAFGRDPDESGLNAMVARLASGGSVEDIAEGVACSAEFVNLYGHATVADEEMLDRMLTRAFEDGRADLPPAQLADWRQAIAGGASCAHLLAAIGQSDAARLAIPLFPGLAPNASPNDDTAYGLWRDFCEGPPRHDSTFHDRVHRAPDVAVILGVSDLNWEIAAPSIRSLQDQVAQNWRLYLGTRLSSPWPIAEARTLADDDPARIHAVAVSAGTPGAGNLLRVALAAALAEPAVDLICFLWPGDLLAIGALSEVQAAFATDAHLAMLFTDEDRHDCGARHTPRFKPGYSPDAMLAGNALGQLTVYRRALLEQVGGIRPYAVEGVLYDLARRASAAIAPPCLRHLTRVLYHRAAAAPDWPARPGHLPPDGPDHAAIEPGTVWPRVRFPVPEPPPLVSVLVLTRDHPDLLRACTAGVLQGTDYPAIELVIVDNGSEDVQAVARLEALSADPRVRLLRAPGMFNFSALNNRAAAQAQGGILVLLNNDIEILHDDWLREMVSLVSRPGIGAVGARLLHPDRTLQHGGMVLSPPGSATHLARGAAEDDPGYGGHLCYTADFAAVTGACLAIPHNVYDAVGGMNEDLAITWNDVDLCQRVRAAGLRILWTPNATLLHREAQTRGLESDDPARHARFIADQKLYRDLWQDAADRDPFLNANLVADDAGLRLATPRAALRSTP